MNAPPDLVERAVALRDHLLPLIREHGEAQEITGLAGGIVVWRAGPFRFALHCPPTPWQVEAPPSAGYEQALARQRAKPVPAWGLDVWHGEKVLSLQWDDPGAFEVVSFVRGPWEDAALALT